MKGKGEDSGGRARQQIWKSLAVGLWIVVSFVFWGSIAVLALFGSAMAEPPAPNADFTALYVLIGFVVLIFLGWCAVTRLVIQTFRPSREESVLAVLIAGLTIALLLLI